MKHEDKSLDQRQREMAQRVIEETRAQIKRARDLRMQSEARRREETANANEKPAGS